MIPQSVRIFVCTEPQDMRRSFDGLALAARDVMGEDPRSGALFCFINRRGNRIKALWFDRTGYCLLYKRAHGVRFERPSGEGQPAVRIDARALSQLLEGIDRKKRR